MRKLNWARLLNITQNVASFLFGLIVALGILWPVAKKNPVTHDPALVGLAALFAVGAATFIVCSFRPR